MDRAFELVFNPPRHAVLRMPLEPLTLGHVFLLHRYQSPFASGGEVKIADLILAALICSLPWRESEKFLTQRRRLNLWLLYWGFRTRKCNVVLEAQKFEAYLTESMRGPKRRVALSEIGEPFESQTPWPIQILARLTKEFHFTREAALDTPVLEAVALFTADEEMRGHSPFPSPEHQALIDNWHRNTRATN